MGKDLKYLTVHDVQKIMLAILSMRYLLKFEKQVSKIRTICIYKGVEVHD